MTSRFDEGEPQRCDCECHDNPQIKHFAACCEECDKCHERFSAGLAKHRKTCTGG